MQITKFLTAAGIAISMGSAMTGCMAETSGGEDVGEVDQAFSSSSCGNVAANAIYAQDLSPPRFSSHDYNNCVRSYVVDLEYLNSFYSGQGNSRDARIDVTYAGPLPTTQAACEKIWVGAIFYKKDSFDGTKWVDQTGQIDAYGRWFAGKCLAPIASSDEGGLVLKSKSSYRIAATARPVYGSATTYPMRFETIPKISIN